MLGRGIRWCFFALVSSVLLTSTLGHAQTEEQRAAENLVFQVYYEGLPFRQARALTRAGSEHLESLLEDPETERFHANVLLALGIAGHPGCRAALARYAATTRETTHSRDSALRMLPLAMGYAAHRDAGALKWLRDRVGDETYPHRIEAVTGLSLAARPEAEAILRGLAGEPGGLGASGSDPGDLVRQRAVAALAYSARLRNEGYEAVLDAE